VRTRASLLILALVGCGGPHDGRTGDAIVDACLHWTACVTPPSPSPDIPFAGCATWSQGKALPWRGDVAITPAQRDCIAAAGLDCAAALDCVSKPASCDKPTWSCDGDVLTFCDVFAGPRAVTRDCGAEGLHCVMLGGEEGYCALDACDPSTPPPAACDGAVVTYCQAQTSWDDKPLGGIVVRGEDCAEFDASCVAGSCVGNGPACTPEPFATGCDGNAIVRCDQSGHEERETCPDGKRCGTSTLPGGPFTCVPLTVCTLDDNFYQCHGDQLEYCGADGNARVDCKQLGYAGCDAGRCVPR
jgi:hypothetical protein